MKNKKFFNLVFCVFLSAAISLGTFGSVFADELGTTGSDADSNQAEINTTDSNSDESEISEDELITSDVISLKTNATVKRVGTIKWTLDTTTGSLVIEQKTSGTTGVLDMTAITGTNLWTSAGYRTSIKTIEIKSGVTAGTSLAGLCNGLYNLTSITIDDPDNFKTDDVTDMNCMFNGCTKLVSVPECMSTWNTSNVTNFNSLFADCESLEEIPDLSGWKTSKVTDMTKAFYNCKKVTDLSSLSSWRVGAVKTLSYAFAGLESLTDASFVKNWQPSSCTYFNEMFESDRMIEELDLSLFNLGKLAGKPAQCAEMLSNVGTKTKHGAKLIFGEDFFGGEGALTDTEKAQLAASLGITTSPGATVDSTSINWFEVVLNDGDDENYPTGTILEKIVNPTDDRGNTYLPLNTVQLPATLVSAYKVVFKTNDGQWSDGSQDEKVVAVRVGSDTTGIDYPVTYFGTDSSTQYYDTTAGDPTTRIDKSTVLNPDSKILETEEVTSTNNGNSVTSTQYTGRVVLYAEKPYTVNFDADNGADAESECAFYGDKISKPADPVKEGFKFTGWFNGDTEWNFDSDVMPVENVNLTAHWEEVKISATFDANGGNFSDESESKVLEETYKKAYELPEEPKQTGKNFAGWFDNKNAEGTPVTSSSIVSSENDITLYACWTDKLVVSFETGCDQSIALQYLNEGEKVTKPDDPVKKGYKFAGWFNGDTEWNFDTDAIGSENITLTAKWEQMEFDVAFDADGGKIGAGDSAKDSITVTETKNEKYSLPSLSPVKTGYTFKGWFTEKDGKGTEVTKDTVFDGTEGVTLYAAWEANKYNVTFAANGGAFETETTAVVAETYDGNYSLPEAAPTKDGYTLKGWNTSADGTGDYVTTDTKVTTAAEATLYAIWEADKITATFDAGEGTFGTASTVDVEETFDSKYMLPEEEPTRAGYEFAGWFTEEEGDGSEITNKVTVDKDENVTFYAAWDQASYTCTFDANGGTFDGSSNTKRKSETYDKKYSLPTTNPSINVDGVNFSGWNTKADGSGVTVTKDSIVKITEDTTFYAQYVFTINFVDASGTTESVIETVNYEYADGATYGYFPETVPAKTGYTFKDWSLIKDGKKPVYDYSAIDYTASKIYVIWQADTHNATFNLCKGNIKGSKVNPVISQTYDSKYALPATPTRDGYYFLGWYTGLNGTGTKVTASTAFKSTTPVQLYAAWKAKSNATIKVKTTSKTYKVAKVKKKAQTLSIGASVTSKGTLSYKVSKFYGKAKKYLSINAKTGKVTVKKKTPKGTYKIKVKISAKATTTYNAATKTVTLKIVVK